jgi:hypothetical protein
MTETGVSETETMRTSLASGHDMMGVPNAAWHLDVLAGAGAMALSQREFFRVDSGTSIGLGWHRRTRGGYTLVWHNGGTGGFRSMMVVDAGAGRAGVVLSNSAHGSDPLGLYLVDGSVRANQRAAREP